MPAQWRQEALGTPWVTTGRRSRGRLDSCSLLITVHLVRLVTSSARVALPVGRVFSYQAPTEHDVASVGLVPQFAVPHQPVDDRTEEAVGAGRAFDSFAHGYVVNVT